MTLRIIDSHTKNAADNNEHFRAEKLEYIYLHSVYNDKIFLMHQILPT